MILELRGISYSFVPERQVFETLSCSLEKGKIYALMGGNGVGKTTLLNIISGFIMPLKGEILFEGSDLLKLKPYQRNRKGIGRTFQDLRMINKLPVLENIILAAKGNPTDHFFKALFLPHRYKKIKEQMHQEASKIIETFFLTNVMDKLAGEISYGQQKLLSLACCIANEVSLLLLDEPVAGIQPEYRDKITMLIKQLKERGKTVLLIEHNMDFIESVADQIFFLHDRKISIFENIETMRKNQLVLSSFI